MEKRIATGTEFAEKMDRVYQHLEGAESEAYLIAQMEREKEHSFATVGYERGSFGKEMDFRVLRAKLELSRAREILAEIIGKDEIEELEYRRR